MQSFTVHDYIIMNILREYNKLNIQYLEGSSLLILRKGTFMTSALDSLGIPFTLH